MDSGRKEYTFLWFIENYSYCWLENGEKLTSPYFTSYGLEGTLWNLWLYPRGYRDEDKSYISIFLGRKPSDGGPENVSIKSELSVLSENGSPLNSLEFDHSFDKWRGRGRPKFLKMDEVLVRRNADYLPEGILTVLCKIWKGEGYVHKVPPICARTRIGIEKISFTHEVEDFITLKPNQKHTIQIRSHSKKEYFASSSLYVTYDSCRDGEMIVEITPSENNHILSKRKISLLGTDNKIWRCEVDNRCDTVRKNIQALPLSLTRQEILDKKYEYLPDGKLLLLCECVFSISLEHEETDEIIPKVTRNSANKIAEKLSTYPSVSEDMKNLYLNQSLTDIQLKTKTKSFPAHKSVLCARSPVFKRMLTSDMKEKNTDCIEVDDLGDDVVHQLLIFLYSDTIENLEWEFATRLYYAADKYQIGKLKEVCSSFLVENLIPTHAGQLLLLSDTHNDTELKQIVED